MGVYSVPKLINEARRLARDYRRATGKPLGGISAEIAQYDAAALLDLELCHPPVGGYDAIGRGPRAGKRVQIKGRALVDDRKTGQRVGQLKLDKDWDCVMLVLMDEGYEAQEIYEAQREDVLAAMKGEGAGRNRRGALSVARFRNIGQLVWTREQGLVNGEIWDNRRDARHGP